MRPAGAMSPQPRAEWSATKRHPGTNGTTPRVADAIIDHTPYRGKSPINRRRPTLLLLRVVAEIGKPNTQGVAALCPGLCAHCPFRTLTIPPPRRDVARNVSTDKGMYRESESKK